MVKVIREKKIKKKIKRKIVVARLSDFKMSARKARVVASIIRGEYVTLALDLLSFQTKRSSFPIKKLLESAISNAEQKGLDIDTLVISKITVDDGPILKRFIPRAHGKANRIRKRTLHINILLK